MITIPDRIGDVIKAIEAGEPVDFKKVKALQALDIIRAGRQFVELAIKQHEDMDDEFQKRISAIINAT